MADAGVIFAHAPFFHQRLALRAFKLLPGPVDPAAAEAEAVRGGHHIADDKAAVLDPCIHIRVREHDTYDRRAVERVRVRVSENRGVHLFQLRDIIRILQHDDLPGLTAHAAGSIRSGLQNGLQLFLLDRLRKILLDASAGQQAVQYFVLDGPSVLFFFSRAFRGRGDVDMVVDVVDAVAVIAVAL